MCVFTTRHWQTFGRSTGAGIKCLYCSSRGLATCNFHQLFLQVKSDVLKGYFKSAGIGRCIFVLVMHALYAVTQILANIWLSEWSNDKFRNQTEAEGMVPLRLGVYGGLSAASCEWLTFSMYAQLLDILTL